MKLLTDALSLSLASHSASDPLTQFACAFSALIHDVNHVGVSNTQLAKEEVPIAGRHKGRSMAEQNSLDSSWDLLMQPQHNRLRDLLFATNIDLVRFRQVSDENLLRLKNLETVASFP